MEGYGSPIISVIIPVYNQEKHLEQCLDSVLAQSIEDIEIICIDDGSTDDSINILERYGLKDRRVKILRQKNGGAGAARNNGLRHARGKYLSFLDSDDFFEPDMLLKAYEQAEKDNADFVVFESDHYLEDEKRFAPCTWAVRENDIPPYNPFSYRQLTDNIFKTFVGWAWDKLYRYSFITEQNLWFQEQRTSNDLLFVFSALVSAKRISVIKEVLAHQRRNNKTSLSNTREKSWFCFYDALIALRQYLKNNDIFWETERDFINYALHFSLWNYRTLQGESQKMLENKLCKEWFEVLGINGKTVDYFYNNKEFSEYALMMKKYSP